MGEYSAEELHYMDDKQLTPNSFLLTSLLAEIFSRFGEDVAGWIYVEKNCSFLLAPGKDVEAQCLRRDWLNPYVVLLPPDFRERYDRNPRGTTMLLLHEVAHAYLGHPRRSVSLDVSRQQERDADVLAAQWYRSSDMGKTGSRSDRR